MFGKSQNSTEVLKAKKKKDEKMEKKKDESKKKLSTKRYLLSYTLNSRSCLFLYFLDSSAMIISLVEVWFGYDLSSILDTTRADILRLV